MNPLQASLLHRTVARGLEHRAEHNRPRFRAKYDAANSSAYHRSAPHKATLIYRDIDPSQRRILMDGSADLADNSPMIAGLIERLVTYVVGCGIMPQSASRDEAFRAEFDAAFEEFAADCEVRGGVTFSVLQAQAFRGELRDGDCGLILTTNNGQPAVYGVEGRQIGYNRNDDAGWYDGVKMDDVGRPLLYKVVSEVQRYAPSEVEVAARNFVLFHDPLRFGLVRGIPLLAPALNTGRDIHDILTLEKLAVKDGSSKTDIIKTASGELSAEDLQATGGDTLNGSDGEAGAKYYREVFGPEAKVLRHGDSWEAYKNDRPSPAWQGFMDFLAQTICLAARIPPSFLLQIKVGGADTRRDVMAAARVIEQTQERLTSQWRRVVYYVIEQKLGRRLPVDWKRISWQYPKSPSVDAGREAQQDREDVRSGMMTEQEYQGRWGGDWRKHRDQVELEAIDKAARAKRVAERAGVTFAEAMEMLGFELKTQPAPAPAAPPAALPQQEVTQ